MKEDLKKIFPTIKFEEHLTSLLINATVDGGICLFTDEELEYKPITHKEEYEGLIDCECDC